MPNSIAPPAKPPLAERILPLIGTIRHYSAEKAKRDLTAAITVALFTIPQAMAYALIAGFPPSTGLASAVVASILGAAFGSSEYLIDGPTNAISAMIASNVAILASQGDPQKMVILLTFMIGISQGIVAIIRAGSLTRFVSESVLIGFTAGAGIYIAVNQLPSALGMGKKDVVPDLWGWTPPKDVVFDFLRASMSLAKANYVAIGVVIATIIVVRIFNFIDTKYEKRLPSTFFTVAIVSAGAYLLGLGDPAAGHAKLRLVQDIEPISRALPHFAFPEVTWDRINALIGPAFAIGILGAVEAIAIAKTLASQNRQTFDANRQLVGESIANMGASLVGGFAVSGSFTRTVVNFEAGARTRFASIYSGVLVLGIIFLFAPVANFIPVAVLAGLLIHIGIRLVNVGKINLAMQASGADRSVLAVTFLAVLFLPDLAHALFLGVALSIVHALRRAEGFRLRLLSEDANGNLVEHPFSHSLPKVIALDLQGELFFAAADELEQKLQHFLSADTKFIVLRLQQAYNMDLTCAQTIKHVAEDARRLGGRLILSGVRPGTYRTLERAGVIKDLGQENVFAAEATVLGSTHEALDFARGLAEQMEIGDTNEPVGPY